MTFKSSPVAPAAQHTAKRERIELRGYLPDEPQFKGQAQRVLDVLKKARREGREVPASELSDIALQYNRCIFTLRQAGYLIENRAWRDGGKIRTVFVLTAEPGEQQLSLLESTEPIPPTPQTATTKAEHAAGGIQWRAD